MTNWMLPVKSTNARSCRCMRSLPLVEFPKDELHSLDASLWQNGSSDRRTCVRSTLIHHLTTLQTCCPWKQTTWVAVTTFPRGNLISWSGLMPLNLKRLKGRRRACLSIYLILIGTSYPDYWGGYEEQSAGLILRKREDGDFERLGLNIGVHVLDQEV